MVWAREDEYRMTIRVLVTDVSGGRVRGTPWLGRIDGVRWLRDGGCHGGCAKMGEEGVERPGASVVD